MARKIRIPITRSGSSILASVLTQAHRNYRASLTPEEKASDRKVIFWIWVVSLVVVLLYVAIRQ